MKEGLVMFKRTVIESGGTEGPCRLTPRRLPLVRLALGTGCLLLGPLVLTVLPPLFQLKVYKFPHHPGLCEADSSQAGHPTGRKKGANCPPTFRTKVQIKIKNAIKITPTVKPTCGQAKEQFSKSFPVTDIFFVVVVKH